MTTNTSPPVRPQRQRRSRARTIVPIAIAVWVALEIWLLTVVAGATNWLVVFLCILAGFVLGAAAVKRAGRSAWQNLAASVNAQQQGVQPGPPQGGGRTGLAMLGGLLLIIPGFVSDAVALVLLIPQARAFIGRRVDRAILGRAVPMPPGGPAGGFGGPGGPGFGGGDGPGGGPGSGSGSGGGPGSSGDKVVQGEVINRD
ncbi:FxsA family membrane protein [Streptomyces sp. NBC_00448]|uniref:FxsA family membrane protein n=1 Tax=Streptomyces sp. NBC_00448 TaxID=2903652 RepID=UPI002E1B6E41